jgi:hypothetical protein
MGSLFSLRSLALLISLSALTTACSNAAQFSSASRIFTFTQAFYETKLAPLDVIWIIDNSGSMNEEAASVRSNLNNFVHTLESIPDSRMVLISAVGDTGTLTRLPATSFPSKQIDINVNSYDALKILQSSMCPVESSTTECNAVSSYASVRGSLSSFLRPDSKKVLVIVSDDESSIAESSFRAVYDSLYAPDSLSVYGWVGLGAAVSPCQARTGTQYLNLASLKFGEMYNVCDADWSSHFAKLSTNVVTLALETIPLPEDILQGEIIAVTINGIPLPRDKYTITNSGIVFDPSIRESLSTAKISIELR